VVTFTCIVSIMTVIIVINTRGPDCPFLRRSHSGIYVAQNGYPHCVIIPTDEDVPSVVVVKTRMMARPNGYYNFVKQSMGRNPNSNSEAVHIDSRIINSSQYQIQNPQSQVPQSPVQSSNGRNPQTSQISDSSPPFHVTSQHDRLNTPSSQNRIG